MSKTIDNLKAAFAGESQANRKYLAFAKQAEKDGLKAIANLFRAAAYAETVHALNHLGIIGEVKSTAENLQAAISGETFEFTKMYPEFIKVADAEESVKAVRSFSIANQVEKIHAGLYSKALNDLKSGKDAIDVEYYVCEVCGNTVVGEAPNKCPICMALKQKFTKIA